MTGVFEGAGFEAVCESVLPPHAAKKNTRLAEAAVRVSTILIDIVSFLSCCVYHSVYPASDK
jgi:hypothetical protein